MPLYLGYCNEWTIVNKTTYFIDRLNLQFINESRYYWVPEISQNLVFFQYVQNLGILNIQTVVQFQTIYETPIFIPNDLVVEIVLHYSERDLVVFILQNLAEKYLVAT